MEWALVLATFLGPIFAVQAQKWVERAQAANERRESVFKALMSSRGSGLSPKHVEALNLITLEFRGDRFRTVNEAWRAYLAHLSETVPQNDPTAVTIWLSKTPDLLTALLAAMASTLRYRFRETDIKSGAYVPTQHVNDEHEQRRLRSALLDLVSGKSRLKTEVSALPEHRM